MPERPPDLFPEVASDPVIAARHRAFSRHQHAAVVDPNDNERYTLRPTLEECLRFAGVDHIDIDVAACPEAHVAPLWLGRQGDGTFIDALGSSWDPCEYTSYGVDGRPLGLPIPRVVRRLKGLVGFCNEPYDRLLEFTERGVLAMIDGELDVLMMLPPGDRCEQEWWQKWVEPYRDGGPLIEGRVKVRTRMLKGRQKFGTPGDPGGLLASSAPFPSVLIVLSR